MVSEGNDYTHIFGSISLVCSAECCNYGMSNDKISSK